jgi:hypothetical protein
MMFRTELLGAGKMKKLLAKGMACLTGSIKTPFWELDLGI